MPWEDAYFRHTDDNRFTNTDCNAWFGIKDDTKRDFSSKGMARGTTRQEIGGAGMGLGKRPCLHTDYHEMIKSTSDKEAFDRMAARGYFPGRALLERPYGSKHYQDMKYQKPVAPLLSQPSPEKMLEPPDLELPDIKAVAPVAPMRIHGKICITNVSRLKICTTNDSTAEGMEIYDGTAFEFTKEALISDRSFNIYIYNITQAKQNGPHVYLFVYDPSVPGWRACTSNEAGGQVTGGIKVVPGSSIYTKPACWISAMGASYWTVTTGTYSGGTYISADQGTYHEIVLDMAGSWASGYRPTHTRITFSGISKIMALLTDQLAGAGGLVERYCWVDPPGGATSTEILTIGTAGSGSYDWRGYDIDLYTFRDLNCSETGQFTITNIEFLD